MSDVLVLSYHAVSERWPAALSVTPGRLEAQLRLLVSRGYRGLTFSEAVRSPAGERVVAVTFDDAFRSVLQQGLPILRRLGLPGTVFVPTDFPGRARMSWPGIDSWLGGPHDGELQPLTWDELRTLAEAGWEIGSHTRSHPHLTRIPDDALATELGESRRLLEEVLGQPCRSLAYPFGDHDDRVVAAAADAGYEAACTVPRRLAAPTPLTWPRVGIYHGNRGAVFRIKVSPAFRRVRHTGAWSALDVALRRARAAVDRATR